MTTTLTLWFIILGGFHGVPDRSSPAYMNESRCIDRTVQIMTLMEKAGTMADVPMPYCMPVVVRVEAK
jgi:hypothetical protein